MSEEWDLERQRSETEDTLKDLSERQGVAVGPETVVTLDIFLVPGAQADAEALGRALAMFGYGGDLEKTEDGLDVYVVTIPDVALTFDDVWRNEERVTKIALERGFTPDGWGFFEP